MQRGKPRNRQIDILAGTPLLNLLATFHRRRRAPATVRKLGVLCSFALGDTLLFSAPLQDLRAAFPQAEIVHLCGPQNLAAAEIIPGADRRLNIRLMRPAATIAALRRERFDALLDFTGWQRLTALYTLLSGAKYTAGFHTAGQRRSRGYDRVVEHTSDRPELENYRAFLRECGLASLRENGLTAPRESGLATPLTPHAPAIDVPPPAEMPFADEPDLIALHAWASGQLSTRREWPQERWIDLAQRLAGPRTLFLITGSPADRERSEPLVARLRSCGLRAELFVSPDGFRTLAAVLRRTRLTVSVNTGVMHLAAIAGAPTVSINGPNRNGRWGPVGPRAIGVEAPGPGCGFLDLGFEFAGNPADCMERTTVDAVYAACLSLQRQSALAPTPAPETSAAEAR